MQDLVEIHQGSLALVEARFCPECSARMRGNPFLLAFFSKEAKALCQPVEGGNEVALCSTLITATAFAILGSARALAEGARSFSESLQNPNGQVFFIFEN